MDHDVIVIGAGLAGLAAARGLDAAGLDVRVLEGGDAVGGRVRTDQVDGYRVDRGFQLLNPAYPALRGLVDASRLDLHAFDRGVAVRRGGELLVVSDPFRNPLRLASLLTGPWRDPRALAGLARWVTAGPRHDDGRLDASLDAAGVTGPLRRDLLDPFLAGVLLDASGATAASFARLMVRYFALGTPSLPAQGMAALPALLAEPVRARITLNHAVDAVAPVGGGWRATGAGGVHTARAIVVATDPRTASRLAGVEPVSLRASTTWWFTTPERPSGLAMLHLHPGSPGVVNTAVMSNVAPSYAPAGSHLVAATTLGESSQGEVQAELAAVYGVDTTAWEVVAHQWIPDSLPVVDTPRPEGRPARVAEGLYVAGDHRAHASIQGALVSGRRAATDLLAWLRP